ncbi:MAG: metallophosphoesterase family protein [Calditrichaeota bacterium]|nr:metallophosphoesterase family protein [Calditrichota bacterium]
MKIAVISDIHANLEALTTVLSYLQQQHIQRIFCLGDVVGYGPRPNECVEQIRQTCEVCLMGNHDHAVVGLTDITYFNQYAQESVLWTRKQLTKSNFQFLKQLKFYHEENDILFVHSTPLNPEEWDYIFSEREARYHLDRVPHRLVFIGHSHLPMVFSYQDGKRYQDRMVLDLKADRYIVNVGSVGQPRDGDPRACFVLYDLDHQVLEYIRLEYDVQKTYQEIIDRNLPTFLAIRLLSGF